MADNETAAPSDDIRSALAAAITTHEEKDVSSSDTKPAAQAQAEEPAAEAAAEPKKDRERGPDGKFLKKEEAAEEEAAAEPEKAAEDDEPKDEAKPEAKKLELPAKWSPKEKEVFAKLPAEAQKLFMDRYKAIEADYTKKTQAIAKLRTDYEPVDKMFEPYRDVMRQKGFTPSSLIESWANIEKKLASGEQGALEVISGLVRGYNVAPAKLAQALGITAGGAPAAAADNKAAAAAPTVQLPPELMREIEALKQQVGGLTTAQRQAIESARAAAGDRAMKQIEDFKSETDADGNPLRPYFEDVEHDMVRLANSYLAAKEPVPQLQKLYEDAVWANPSTREQLRTLEKESAEKKRTDEARAKAAAAKKAGSSVTGAPGTGSATSPHKHVERSLREELDAAAAESLSAA